MMSPGLVMKVCTSHWTPDISFFILFSQTKYCEGFANLSGQVFTEYTRTKTQDGKTHFPQLTGKLFIHGKRN
jgi:hypothetical protein